MTMARLIIYSLKNINERSILSIDLTGLIDPNNPDQSKVKINLKSGLTTLNLWDYFNKPNIYDDGCQFFLICNKSASREWAFKTLLRHAVKKVEQRVNNLNEAKQRYLNELAA